MKMEWLETYVLSPILYYLLFTACIITLVIARFFKQISWNTTTDSGSDAEDLQLLSYGTVTAIAITAVLCIVTSLILLGALLHHIINKARSKPPTPPHDSLPEGVINEEVDISASETRGEAFQLNLNEAYALVEKKTRQV